jgi:biotin carboxyl carrier protein
VAASGDLSVLPTSAFFYGMKPGQEISIEIEPGKTLFIRMVNIGAVDAEGKRVVNFELNGMSRQISIVDKSVKPTVKARVKADPAKSNEVGAPIPGLVTALSVSVGAKVAKGDKLVTLEAMKMQTTIYAPCDGVVGELAVHVGDAVESKDLLLKLRRAEAKNLAKPLRRWQPAALMKTLHRRGFVVAVACCGGVVLSARAELATNRFGFTGPEIFPIENGIGMMHAADLDGDGLKDVVVVNNVRSKITLLYNQTGKTNVSRPKSAHQTRGQRTPAGRPLSH